MELEELYAKVSDAIEGARYARRRGGDEAKRANLEVSALEQQIAQLLPASDPEGVIARRSAVRTAILAGETDRAKELATRYSIDASPEFRDELRVLLEGAGIRLVLPDAPSLFPIEVGEDARLHKAPAPIRAVDDGDDIDFEPLYAGLRRVLAEFVARVANCEASAARRYLEIAEKALSATPAEMANCSYLSLNRQLRLLLAAGDENWVGVAERSLVEEAGYYFEQLPRIFEPLAAYRLATQRDGFVSPPASVRQAMIDILESAATDRAVIGDDLAIDLGRAEITVAEAPETDSFDPERSRKWEIADAYFGAGVRIEAVKDASASLVGRGETRFSDLLAKVSPPIEYLEWRSSVLLFEDVAF